MNSALGTSQRRRSRPRRARQAAGGREVHARLRAQVHARHRRQTRQPGGGREGGERARVPHHAPVLRRRGVLLHHRRQAGGEPGPLPQRESPQRGTGRDGATGGGVRAALLGKTLEPPPRVLWLSRLKRPGAELPLPAPLTLPRSRYSTAAAPTSSCRTCSWTRTTCASPGSPSSPASESHRVWVSPPPGVPGLTGVTPLPPPPLAILGRFAPISGFSKGEGGARAVVTP